MNKEADRFILALIPQLGQLVWFVQKKMINLILFVLYFKIIIRFQNLSTHLDALQSNIFVSCDRGESETVLLNKEADRTLFAFTFLNHYKHLHTCLLY